MELTSDSTSVQLRRVSGGTVTTLATVTANTVTIAKQWLRLRVVGSTIQFKIWLDGQAEPATWRSTVTDGQVTAAGQLYLTNVRSSSNSGTKYVAIDDVDVTDGN